MPPRQRLLILGLVLSIGATLWAHSQDKDSADIVAPVDRVVATGEAANPPKVSSAVDTGNSEHATSLALDRLSRRHADGEIKADPFTAKSWFVPPPLPPPVVVQPAAPAAPALPFAYMGMFEDPSSGKVVVYLAKGDKAFQVSAGEKFDDDTYRLSKIERGFLVIDYLPLSIQQRLTIGVAE